MKRHIRIASLDHCRVTVRHRRRVGGLGLSLPAADVVIFVEHDWNPYADLQVNRKRGAPVRTRPAARSAGWLAARWAAGRTGPWSPQGSRGRGLARASRGSGLSTRGRSRRSGLVVHSRSIAEEWAVEQDGVSRRSRQTRIVYLDAAHAAASDGAAPWRLTYHRRRPRPLRPPHFTPFRRPGTRVLSRRSVRRRWTARTGSASGASCACTVSSRSARCVARERPTRRAVAGLWAAAPVTASGARAGWVEEAERMSAADRAMRTLAPHGWISLSRCPASKQAKRPNVGRWKRRPRNTPRGRAAVVFVPRSS